MEELVLVTRDGEVGLLTVNNPPVNALAPGVAEAIRGGLDAHIADPEVRAIVLIGGGRTFIAGADIKQFANATVAPVGLSALSELPRAMENSPKPVIAALHGTALGGGLEVAMGAHYRVALESARLGQPEVKIGLIPGAAGTQRLPRLAGTELAARMCVFGEMISARDALAAGLVDRIVEGDLAIAAADFARTVSECPKPRDRAVSPVPEGFFDALRAEAGRRLPHQATPQRAVDAVEAATLLDFEAGCSRERALFEECLADPQSKALIHAFFAEREAAKVPGVDRQTPVRSIASAGVVGAGTMGTGIAIALAQAGIPVLLRDLSADALARGKTAIEDFYARAVSKGRLTADEAARRAGAIQCSVSWDGWESVDLAIEAVFEEMALKKQVFAELDAITRPGCLLASNTSTLSVSEITGVTGRPQDGIGLHFFSPAPVMRLLEIVRGRETSPEAVATAQALARRLGKVGVVSGDSRGFIGNRMFHVYLREAQFLVEEGAEPAEVDAALAGYGMAMGPLAVADLAGLDVGWRIRKEHRHLEPPGERQPRLGDLLCEKGRFGQKTGAGWYRYREGRVPEPDPEVTAMAFAVASGLGIERRQIQPEEILDRTLLALANEGFHLLEEGVALRESDIDLVYLTGYGFPAWRGGPMHAARAKGLESVLERILEFRERFGAHWSPAPALTRR